jgi:hypothetical protein
MISGELLVVGSNSVSLRLRRGKPDRVRVYFKCELVEIPCSNAVPDELDFEVTHTNGQHFLVIEWSVSSAREVVWEADY